MRLPVLAAALALLTASGASAADCTVNFVANNTTAYTVWLSIETRTRANPGWYMGSINSTDRRWVVQPGARLARTVTMPIVGCRVQRELRVTQTCWTTDPQGPGSRIMSERILHPWGTGLHRPRDITVNVRC